MTKVACHRCSQFARLFLMLVLCFMLSACSTSADEEVLRNAVTAFLDIYKQPTRELAVDLVDDQTRQSYDQLELYGVDGYAIMQQYFAKFDYTIDEIAIKGDQATVSVTMRNIDVMGIVEDTLSKYSTDKGKETIAILQSEGGDNMVYQYVYGDLYDRLKETNTLVSIPTAITLTKTNGSWTVDDKCIPNVMGAIYGGSGLSVLL